LEKGKSILELLIYVGHNTDQLLSNSCMKVFHAPLEVVSLHLVQRCGLVMLRHKIHFLVQEAPRDVWWSFVPFECLVNVRRRGAVWSADHMRAVSWDLRFRDNYLHLGGLLGRGFRPVTS
jgi:hypothetical protein